MTINQHQDGNAQRILFDPLSWIHPQRFTLPQGFSSSGCRRVLNDILLVNFDLPIGELDFSNQKERYLARHWHLIADAAFMVNCQRYKASLLQQGLWWKLDSATRQFASLEWPGVPVSSEQSVTLEQLRAMALQDAEDFAGTVSVVMKSRLPLLFPCAKEAGVGMNSRANDNGLMMTMAIQHAKRNE